VSHALGNMISVGNLAGSVAFRIFTPEVAGPGQAWPLDFSGSRNNTRSFHHVEGT